MAQRAIKSNYKSSNNGTTCYKVKLQGIRIQIMVQLVIKSNYKDSNNDTSCHKVEQRQFLKMSQIFIRTTKLKKKKD